ncbi:transposase TRm17b [Mesorhizobium sp. LNJC372A00]|nr:transposase TRm17b [Mesorhizobium sp. LNJC374B00]ESY52264.1 transposase TRm17b [Mesorhizobium sp. LNJC372A00]
MILDLVIETGNPRDSDRLLPMLERHIAFYGQAPRQATDGGFASSDNLATAKTLGVGDMAFQKKAVFESRIWSEASGYIASRATSVPALEAGTSCLKRAYGLARCTWRGLDHFKTYVWSSVVAFNVVLVACLKRT